MLTGAISWVEPLPHMLDEGGGVDRLRLALLDERTQRPALALDDEGEAGAAADGLLHLGLERAAVEGAVGAYAGGSELVGDGEGGVSLRRVDDEHIEPALRQRDRALGLADDEYALHAEAEADRRRRRATQLLDQF